MPARLTLICLTAIAAILVGASSASAATTMGSDLALPPGDGVFCDTTCTSVQTALAGRVTAAPFDGVIVRWRIRTNAAGGPFALRVAMPFGGNDRTSGAVTAPISPPSGGITETLTRISIKSGDNLGLDYNAANTAQFKPGFGVPGAQSLYFKPQLALGVKSSPFVVNEQTETLFNADIEADADNDGFGDETQDRCPGINGTADGCDIVAPVAVVVSTSSQKIGSLMVKVSVNETATVLGRAVVTYRFKGRNKTLKGRYASLSLAASSPSTKLPLRFSSKFRSRLRSLIKSGRRLSAKVTVVATDPSGNKSTLTPKIRLKR